MLLKKYLIATFFLGIILHFSSAYAQETSMKRYSLDGSAFRLNDSEIINTLDNGYAVAVSARTNPWDTTVRGFLFKERQDTLVFNKSYLSNTGATEFHGILELEDKGFVACGYTEQPSDEDLFLMRTDSLGNVIWAHTYELSGKQRGHNLVKSNNTDEFVMSCVTGGRISFAQFNSDGDLLDFKYLNESIGAGYVDIIKTTDYGYLISSYSDDLGSGSFEALVIKLDSSFNVTWSNTYWLEEKHITAYSAVEGIDGGFALTGAIKNVGLGENSDLLVFKIDSIGNFLWSKVYPEWLSSSYSNIKQYIDSTYLIAASGHIDSINYFDCGMIRIDMEGEINWSYFYDEPTFHNISGDFIINLDSTITMLGEDAIVGHDDDILLFDIDQNGHIGCNEVIRPFQPLDTHLNLTAHELTFSVAEPMLYDTLVLVVEEMILKDTLCTCTNPPFANINPIFCFSDSVLFNADIYNEESISIVNWNFGDGYYSDSLNPVHLYEVYGDYIVSLTLTDSNGCSTLNYELINLEDDSISFFYTYSGFDYSFENTSSFGGDIEFIWDFGDGDADTVTNALHTYDTTGTFVVCLTANGMCDTITICDTLNLSIGDSKLGEHQKNRPYIYPNPTKGGFWIYDNANNTQIKIFNLQGEVIYTYEHNGDGKVDFYPSPGVYLVQFKSESSNITSRLIVTN